VRPVNLLPARHKPRTGTGRRGTSYPVLGVLGALLLATVMYVLAGNQVTSRQGDLAKAQRETQEAQAKSSALASFGSFAQIKETRLQSVRSLAGERFDWERMSREIAHVMPSGVSLTSFEATLTGESGPAGKQASAGTDAAAAAQPQLRLVGCAPGHEAVADTLVRLRRLHRAEDVSLAESAHGEGGGSSESGGSGAACDGKQSYGFQAVVKFSVEQTDEQQQQRSVPARLGGGS
jgi:Tfp pilus assembly protein PilN